MNTQDNGPRGLWLPLITPFRDGALDETSVNRLVAHYVGKGLTDGIILAATTGEGMTLDGGELERLVELTRASITAAASPMQVYLGLSGSDTRKCVDALGRTADWPVDGYLITCPYYSRPSQEGLLQHFSALADATDRPILIYNIPYRTGVNLGNETMLRLAERANIVGVKDCCADQAQSFELMRHRPEGFSVLTGEDALFYSALVHGADGGITASAHVATEDFAGILGKLSDGDQAGALTDWQRLVDLPRLLFAEPSPAPMKYWLWRTGLIDSGELRLPMAPVSDALAARIDKTIDAEAAWQTK